MQTSAGLIEGGDDDHFATSEEISRMFDFIQKTYEEYENCETKVPFEDTIKILKKLEKSIILHAIFSPNEEFKEIPTENIKYILVPYYISSIFGRIQTNRKSNLMISKTYLDEFIKLANFYGLVTKEQRKNWKTRMENMNYEPTREEKIQGFKENKELQTKMKNLELVKDEDTKRELLRLQIESVILKAIEEIRMIHMEMQLQEHKEKIEKSKLSGDKTLAKEEKVGPMKIWHIPKPSQENQSFMMSETKTMCQHCDPMYNMKIREDLQSTVFQPGTNQPTMTLEEFGDKEYKKMMQLQEQQKLMAEQTKMEEEEDSDKDEKSDKKTKKDRDWDDWKDEHEKGAGNKKKIVK